MLHKLSPEVRQQVESGVSILRGGGVVAYPTDTVYGLGASMAAGAAMERVYRLKRRPRDMALPLLLSRTSQFEEVATQIPLVARRLATRFLPGALTIILPAAQSVPGVVTAGSGTVAVRVPDHPVPIALIEATGAPLVGTSANVSGQPSPLTAAGVLAQFGDSLDLIIDDGDPCRGHESTIVDVTGETPVLLREGAISVEALRQVCGTIKIRGG